MKNYIKDIRQEDESKYKELLTLCFRYKNVSIKKYDVNGYIYGVTNNGNVIVYDPIKVKAILTIKNVVCIDRLEESLDEVQMKALEQEYKAMNIFIDDLEYEEVINTDWNICNLYDYWNSILSQRKLAIN